MSKDRDSESLLDLSFLTEEEQSTIVQVLSRDTELRQKDEGRVRKLRQTVSDPGRLKVLSGDWFCDVRSRRHRGKKFGSDIVQASIRRKRKPKGPQAMPYSDHPLGVTTATVTGERERSPWPAEVLVISDETEEAVLDKPETGDRALEEVLPDPVQLLPSEPLLPAHHQDPSDSVQLANGDAEETSMGDQEPVQQQSENEGPEQAEEPRPEPPAGGGSEQEMEDILLSPVIITVQSDEEPDNAQQMNSLVTKRNSSLDSHHIPLKSSLSLNSLGSTTLSGSVMSLYSDGEIGSVEVRGCIQFSLQYDARKKELLIVVIQCRDLAEAKKQRSDPYVKSYLLPDKSSTSKRKTTVKKRCLDPLFNEALKYKIEKLDLQSRVLNLSVWHRDPLGKNLFLGEVEIELSSWDWSHTQPNWFNLQPRVMVAPGVISSRGKVVLSLKFIPSGSEGAGLPPSGELHIWVKEAQYLLPLRTGTIDSFVKCYLLPDDSKSSRQKTRVIKKSLNPTFNHTMVYDGFRSEDLQEACAEFTLWDQEKFSSQQLGGVRLSMGRGSSYGLPVPWMDSTEEEKQVWSALIQKPNEWVDTILPLRTNLTPRA